MTLSCGAGERDPWCKGEQGARPNDPNLNAQHKPSHLAGLYEATSWPTSQAPGARERAGPHQTFQGSTHTQAAENTVQKKKKS